MSVAQVHAVRACLPVVGDNLRGSSGLDDSEACRNAANLAHSLAMAAECAPTGVAADTELHSLFGQLVGLLPPVSLNIARGLATAGLGLCHWRLCEPLHQGAGPGRTQAGQHWPGVHNEHRSS